ncbi:helix-turn-helix domain-containing protein [Acinetobacter chengduensis]|uniref:XRE family transcriptional regulator n=1 Tax=Acinetobacter chengduensis TaxID=2420890 RepID=A0ABX9TSN7_9GAMM|nr:helix-turn-helix transcriptional regulator [Acinetobacter chengduensis]RLL19024.1 XRE family transcriptional regulator [Acinetobacter chengduensis]
MAQNRQKRDEELQITIGRNLKIARQMVARLSLKQVMLKVWGVQDRKNRISEIEGGMRMPSPYILVRLAILYGVSLDFIFGLSSDIERDIESSRAGQITQGLREIAIDTVDRIGLLMAKQVSVMPRMEAVTLKDQSLELIYFLRKNLPAEVFNELEVRNQYIDLCNQVENSCRTIESMIARHSRILELSILDHINKTDSLIVSEFMTDHALKMDHPPEVKEYRPIGTDINVEDGEWNDQPLGLDTDLETGRGDNV